MTLFLVLLALGAGFIFGLFFRAKLVAQKYRARLFRVETQATRIEEQLKEK